VGETEGREVVAAAGVVTAVARAADVALAPGVAAQAPTSPHARSRESARAIGWVVLIVSRMGFTPSFG